MTIARRPATIAREAACAAMRFNAIVTAFGEEYGWRGYLQSELFKLGRARRHGARRERNY